MFYLIGAILTNSAETIVTRFSEKRRTNRYAVTMFNYITALLLCWLCLGDVPLWQSTVGYVKTLCLATGNGIIYITWLLLFQLSVNRNGAPLSATFTKLGVLLPILASILFFSETPRPIQLVGIGVAVASVVFFNLPEKKIGISAPPCRFRLGLFLIMVVGGCADFNSKVFETFGQAELDAVFLFYTFGVALCCSILVWWWEDRSIRLQDILFGILIGIPNQVTTLLLLRAILCLPAFLVFPVYSVGGILLVSLTDFLLFREPLSRKQYVSIALIAFSLICLNL